MSFNDILWTIVRLIKFECDKVKHRGKDIEHCGYLLEVVRWSILVNKRTVAFDADSIILISESRILNSSLGYFVLDEINAD